MTLDVMGINEIAEHLGVEPDKVYVWHQRGKLPKPDAIVGGGRTKLWRRSTIQKWIRQQEERT